MLCFTLSRCHAHCRYAELRHVCCYDIILILPLFHAMTLPMPLRLRRFRLRWRGAMRESRYAMSLLLPLCC